MLGTIALTLLVVSGLAFIFTALIVEDCRSKECPEKRILREAEEIILQASRALKREAARLQKADKAATAA